MAQKPILEYDAKALIAKVWDKYFGDKFNFSFQSALIDDKNSLKDASASNPWLKEKSLVVKPDMLFGARGKNNLVLFKDKTPGDVTYAKAEQWLNSKVNQKVALLDGTEGVLNRFIVEPFIPHEQSQEYYICASAEPGYDVLYMSASGGVNIMEEWDKVNSVEIPLDADQDQLLRLIFSEIPQDIENKEQFTEFALAFYNLYKDLHFTYLELNPFVLQNNNVQILDTVAKLDDTAGFMMNDIWENIEYYSSFGQKEPSPEERMIEGMDEKSGSSMKLTVLNPKGLVWTLVAGGGASVVFADSIAQTWGVNELANYGEYSGNPTQEETYYYAKTVIDLMTRKKDADGRDKILLIGGAIANFTDVAKTFSGIIQAFNDMADRMLDTGVRIYVRRGGPNYKTGLKNIRLAAKKLNLNIEVFGPETHLTEIVRISKEDIINY
jgi:ATP-citrate lyase beta-subunit